MNKLSIPFVLILVVCILSGVIESSSNNALSDLEQIFTGNVEIIDYTLSPPETYYDNDKRMLIIKNKMYPYPKEIELITNIQTDNSTLIMGVWESLPDTTEATQRRRSWVWYFYPQAEVFTRYMPLCDDPKSVGIDDIESPWIYITDSDTEQVYLCELATGELSEPLPSSLSWEVLPPISSLPLPVFASPDGRWLILFGEENKQTHIFSYNISSDIITELGLLSCNFCVEWGAVSWFGSTAMVWSWNEDKAEHLIYSVDITQTNSLELAISRLWYLPEFYNNPPRYDYVKFTTPENFWDTQCEHVIYDILSEETQVTDMGSVCFPEKGSLDGIGYYREVTAGEEGIATLTRFDATTGVSEVLYEGEIESIEWVSSDEHYAVLVLGSNEYIDVLPFREPKWSWYFPDSPKLAYVDLINDEVIFENWTDWHWCDVGLGGPDWWWSDFLSESSVRSCSTTGPTGAILPRADDTTLVIGTVEPQEYQGYIVPTEFADVITVNDGSIERVRIAEGYLTPFSADYVLKENRNSAQGTISYSLVPVDGSPLIPITNEIRMSDYERISLTDIYPETNQVRFYFDPKSELERDWFDVYVTVKIQIP